MLWFYTLPGEEKGHIDSNAAIEACIERISRGDAASLEQLYGYVKTSVYAFAFSILKNPYDAEDVTHDLLIRVWESAAGYTPCGKPMAWLLTVARNLCLMKLRGERNHSELSEWIAVAAETETAEDRILIAKCMEQLSEEERQVVVLHAVAGFKHREIAQFTHLSLGSVLSKYNRALKKLKKICEGE